MKVILFIAWRYLFSRKKNQAIHILGLITIMAMACGAGALIVILSVFNGFENISKSLSESFQPDLIVYPTRNKLFDIPNEKFLLLKNCTSISSVSKVLEDKVYVRYANQDAIATIKGVDSSFFGVNSITEYIVAGDSILETEEYSFGILGAGLASKLNIDVQNNLESLTVYYPKDASNSSVHNSYEFSYLIPGGVFSIFQDYDEKYILAPLNFVQYLSSSESTRVSALEIRIKDNCESKAREDIQKILGAGFYIKNKLEQNETFYKISRIEKLVVSLILSFVLVILSFNFIGSLTMLVIEKTQDIQILNYLGITQNKIYKLFVVLGLFQGLLGGIIGLSIGILICWIQKQFGIIEMPGSGTFVIQSYPVEIRAIDTLFIFLIIFTVSLLASLIPAMNAKKSSVSN